MITPSEYEKRVAVHFRELGYSTEVTSYTNDYGLDVLAEKDGERIAVQAKVYGHTSRQVNRQMIMELHGVKDYFDCDRAVLATDGIVRRDAKEVAAKLGVEILNLSAEPAKGEVVPVTHATQSMAHAISEDDKPSEMAFERIWLEHVMPLEGKVLHSTGGRTNTILSVDWSGVERVTSTGRKDRIEIEIFKLSINHLLRYGVITRDEINQNYAKRASSGVILVLSQVPLFTLKRRPSARLLLTEAA